MDRGNAPVLVVTAHELGEYLRDLESSPAEGERAYTQANSWKKTDIASTPGGAITAGRVILGGDVRVVGGWSVVETTGAAAAVARLWDGRNANGELITPWSIASAGQSLIAPTGRGIEVSTGGLFVSVTSGSIAGVIYWR